MVILLPEQMLTMQKYLHTTRLDFQTTFTKERQK